MDADVSANVLLPTKFATKGQDQSIAAFLGGGHRQMLRNRRSSARRLEMVCDGGENRLASPSLLADSFAPGAGVSLEAGVASAARLAQW